MRNPASKFGLFTLGATLIVVLPLHVRANENMSVSPRLVITPDPAVCVPSDVAPAVVEAWSSALSGSPKLWMTAKSSSVLLAPGCSPMLHCEIGSSSDAHDRRPIVLPDVFHGPVPSCESPRLPASREAASAMYLGVVLHRVREHPSRLESGRRCRCRPRGTRPHRRCRHTGSGARSDSA